MISSRPFSKKKPHKNTYSPRIFFRPIGNNELNPPYTLDILTIAGTDMPWGIWLSNLLLLVSSCILNLFCILHQLHEAQFVLAIILAFCKETVLFLFFCGFYCEFNWENSLNSEFIQSLEFLEIGGTNVVA